MKIKNGRNTITAKIAYIAGFFDGEGCVRIKKSNQSGNSYYVWVAITNSNYQILESIEQLFGGRINKVKKGVGKVVYHYLITCDEACDFLKTCLYFLRDKQEQAMLAIWFHEEKRNLTPEQKEDSYEKMKRLKIGNIYENPLLIKPTL